MMKVLIVLCFLVQSLIVQAQGFTTLGIIMGDNVVPFCEESILDDGQFTTWVGDNPNPTVWAVVMTEDATNYITENPAGVCEIHCDNLSSTLMTSKAPYVLSIGSDYDYSFDIYQVSGTRIEVYIGDVLIGGGTPLTTGHYSGTVTALATTAVTFLRWSGEAMIQIDNLCITAH